MQPLAKCRNDFGLNHRLNNGRRSQRNSADPDEHNYDRKSAARRTAGWQIAVTHRGESLYRDIEAINKRPAFDQTEAQGPKDERNAKRDNRITNAKESAKSMGDSEGHKQVSGFEFRDYVSKQAEAVGPTVAMS